MKSKSLVACISGNIIEWYEFSLFVFLAAQISPHFFNISEPITAKVFVLLTFAIGFISRPLGGVIFGVIGDAFGRKKVLFFSVSLMTFANCLIGILPGYADIGWISPALLILCRLAQGISGGGEFTTSMVYLTENSKDQQTMAGSLSYSGAQLGLLVGAIVGFTQNYLVNTGALPAESWHFLFFLCLPLGVISYYLRLHLVETRDSHHNVSVVKNTKQIFSVLFSKHRKEMMVVFFINALAMSVFYTFLLYVINWNKVENVQQYWGCVFSNSFLLLLIILFLPIFGRVSIKFKLKHYLSLTGLALVIFLYPLITSPDGHVKFGIAIIYALFIAAFLAPLPQFFCLLFPRRVRNTGVAISFNLAAVLFGPTSAAVINFISPNEYFIQSLYLYFLSIFAMAFIGIHYADKKLKLRGDVPCLIPN